jgi:hypothetical protein
MQRMDSEGLERPYKSWSPVSMKPEIYSATNPFLESRIFKKLRGGNSEIKYRRLLTTISNPFLAITARK